MGSLFAAVANQYVVSNSLPLAGTLTLVNTIHELTYLAILFCFVLSLLSCKCALQAPDKSRPIDRWGFGGLLTAYVVIVAAVVARAVARG